MEEREKIQARIKKLLTLSGNNPNKEEAESAFLKAQELLLKYKIEMHEIDSEAEDKIKIVRVQAKEAANTPWARSLASIIAKNFRCMKFMSSYGKTHFMCFFGEEDDAEVASSMFDYCVVWLNKKACAYATKMRNERGMVKGVKQDYILGFLKGLEDKFRIQVEQNSQYALAVIIPVQVKKEYENLGLTKVNLSNNMNTHGSHEAVAAGYAEGRSFQNVAIGS